MANLVKQTELYRAIQRFGTDASFVANLIVTRHNCKLTKLTNLLSLLRSGSDVRTAQFSCDTLIINGSVAKWEVLDTPTRSWLRGLESESEIERARR